MPNIPAVRHRQEAEEMIARLSAQIDALSGRTFIDRLLQGALRTVVSDLRHALAGKCPEDPMAMLGQPIGMYHCPSCGCMVVAGMPGHPHDDGCWLGLDDENFGPSPDDPQPPPEQWPPS